ncbi:hypothetical protein F5X96DRAFT_690000 [Biscogniauxia mediterranea]|nr:hypothetical protein F5X96DRAFT_690000 [Biscogniauxia mediterranea]
MYIATGFSENITRKHPSRPPSSGKSSKMVGPTRYTDEQINFILDRTVRDVARGETVNLHLAVAREFREAFGEPDFGLNQVRYVTERYGSDPDYGNRWGKLVRPVAQPLPAPAPAPAQDAGAVAVPTTPGVRRLARARARKAITTTKRRFVLCAHCGGAGVQVLAADEPEQQHREERGGGQPPAPAPAPAPEPRSYSHSHHQHQHEIPAASHRRDDTYTSTTTSQSLSPPPPPHDMPTAGHDDEEEGDDDANPWSSKRRARSAGVDSGGGCGDGDAFDGGGGGDGGGSRVKRIRLVNRYADTCYPRRSPSEW